MENDQIIKMIGELVEDKYIKEGWFDNIDINSFTNNENKYQTSIIDCINNCTSPRASEKNNQITEDDLKLIFKAFSLFEPSKTRVLILGQDPYPDDDEYRVKHYGKRAQGLAFSFLNSKKDEGKPEPAADSLENIFEAIAEYKKQNDDIYTWNTNLETWASKNGILLLNTALTFESEDKSHFEYWNDFIKNIIKILVQTKLDNNCNNKLAIFLWGEKAQNIFFESLNDIIKNDIIKNFIEKDDEKIAYKNKSKFKKISSVIQKDKCICLSEDIKLYMTYHPSNRYKPGKEQFLKDTPKHFKACDEFLEEPIFKDFPENNKEEYYKK